MCVWKSVRTVFVTSSVKEKDQFVAFLNKKCGAQTLVTAVKSRWSFANGGGGKGRNDWSCKWNHVARASYA